MQVDENSDIYVLIVCNCISTNEIDKISVGQLFRVILFSSNQATIYPQKSETTVNIQHVCYKQFCGCQTIHLTMKVTLKPALASKLAKIRMPLYKPCWYVHD